LANPENNDNFAKGMSSWENEDNDSMSNYSIWQANLIIQYLGKKVLDVGAGSGRFSSLLVEKCSFERYLAVEPSDFFYNFFSTKYPNIESIKTTTDQLDSSFNNQFDTIVSIHVMEHIENDKNFLIGMDRFLINGGKIIIMVPAMQFLMSDLDRNIGHYRRYNQKMIKDLVKDLDYKIIKMRYDNIIGLFGWLWLCKIRKIHYQTENKKTSLVNSFKIFDKIILPIFSKIEKYISLPVGLNLTVVLQKTKN
jgi:ubiquinone/menaquinone biosynthesis C-methylase UbiE